MVVLMQQRKAGEGRMDCALLLASAQQAGRLGHHHQLQPKLLPPPPPPLPLVLLVPYSLPSSSSSANPPSASHSQPGSRADKSQQQNEGNRAHPGRPVWQPDRSQGESPKQPWIGFKKLYFSPQSLVSKLQVVCVENRWICRLERPAHGWIGRGPRGSRPFSKI